MDLQREDAQVDSQNPAAAAIATEIADQQR